ncbi:hypothetical protein E2562_007596 [Oryza meyeriana var. granulata]|uniref:Uncharacterized protein n=1 Tax=Oryza meyeriana var. granulata TaxID=110450 RepID=A0A6G1DV68_9ORYZ|nr:hypothetical protein E2562_007596 [Oryza meyeriana var. granulata]
MTHLREDGGEGHPERKREILLHGATPVAVPSAHGVLGLQRLSPPPSQHPEPDPLARPRKLPAF